MGTVRMGRSRRGRRQGDRFPSRCSGLDQREQRPGDNGFEKHLGGRIEKTWCLLGVMEGRKEEVPRGARGVQV